ncbi:hypothetical protein [Luteirhabdus pelagi]|uniref:hypothetical protein n=1 Tax=Luteirhabdus pelagi TaxID=2792783 RepID=UPI001939E237|nr:hypothetical protein [Luteirhabdus pelagi]
MKHPTKFTFLGFLFNSLVDSGEEIKVEIVHQKLRDKKLFEWLSEKYGNRLDLSLYTKSELELIENFFQGLSLNMNERRKVGVQNNGLCLLTAYCIEGAQRKEEHIR